MKLYFSPGACSLSPRIVLHEAGLAFTSEKVDLVAKKTANGRDYRTINPKGYVPALELDEGVVLTEGPAIVQYLADQVPDKLLAPAPGTLERYQLMSLLNFISTELHKSYSPLFRPDSHEAVKTAARSNLLQRYSYVNAALEGKPFLLGERFSVADAYLFVVTTWAGAVGIDLAAWPNVQAFQQRMAERPAVREAMREEGLLD
jgi:glutathione S-transferase